jgi:hypothetical protein
MVVSATQPWYTFPRIDNLGGVEPFGGFPKPDSNIQLPAGYPITALLPGTVTAVDGSNVAWGGVVTIRLDKPLNYLATHTAYLHLASETVGIGQHVQAGQLIAYNGSAAAQGTQKVPLGFALYNGDHYGFGAAWAYMTKANLSGGPLDPVPLLNAARDGRLNIPDASNLYSAFASGSGLNSAIIDGPLLPFKTLNNTIQSTLINVPGFEGLVEAFDIAEQWQPLTLPNISTSGSTNNTNYTLLGIDTGIPNPSASVAQAITLPADTMQALLTFIVLNTRAALIRGILIFLGIVILIALFMNIYQENVSSKINVGSILGMLK